VSRLGGCLALLPALQRTTLILRFGVGPVAARSRSAAARVLGLSRSRVRQLELTGIQSLEAQGQNAQCGGSSTMTTTLVAVHALLAGRLADGFEPLGSRPPAREGGTSPASGTGAGSTARRSGPGTGQEDPPLDHETMSSGGPVLGAPFANLQPSPNNPVFLVLLAITMACLVPAVREFVRASR
jgi:Sigma-70, region 4